MTHRIAGWVVLPMAMILIGAGCGASEDTPASSGGVTVSTTSTTIASSDSTRPAGEPVTVRVEAGDYYFKSTIGDFQAGVPYHFEVINVGEKEHEFMLLEPIAPGMMDMEAMDAMALGHIEDADLQPGDTATVDITFDKSYPAGTLEMACHIGQHYEKGMHLPMTVGT